MFKQEWTVESALKIVQHPTVESELWAEAVEWLLLYGPEPIKAMLQQASGFATNQSFPDLQPQGYAPDGSPCYTVTELAQALGIPEEQAQEHLKAQERRHGIRQGYDEDDTTPLQ